MEMQGTIFQFEEAPSCPLYLAPPHSNLWNTKKAENPQHKPSVKSPHRLHFLAIQTI